MSHFARGVLPPQWVDRRIDWAAGLLLVVMTAAAYLPVAQCGFIWDDDACIQRNQVLRSADGLQRIWFEDKATPYQYYPMVHTSYWLEYRLWGLNPAGYHLVNVLLHAVGVVLLWRVLRLLEIPGAWVAAALFALHPVHVESVAWITERKNVLSGVFYFAAALLYLRLRLGLPTRRATSAATPGTRRSPAPAPQMNRRMLYVASLALFLLGLLSKAATCTLPAVLLLVLWWKGRRGAWRELVPLGPFFALGIGMGLFCAWMETDPHHVSAVGQEWNQSFIERCLIAGRALCFYTGKLFWPGQLTFSYPRWQIDAADWRQYVYPLAVIGGIAGLWLARRRIGVGPLVGVLCFAGTLFPALGFFNVYYMQFSFVADHWQYLASVGLLTLVAAGGWLAAGEIGRWGKKGGVMVLAMVLATLGTLTWHQIHIYKDLETLWRDTLQKNPDAWMARNNLGAMLEVRGEVDEAISQFRQALKVKPTFADAHNNLANVLLSRGRSEEAIGHYRQALEAKPGSAKVHNNLASALGEQGRREEAITQYRRALQLNPEIVEAHYNLALTLKWTGRHDEAQRHFREAMRLKPNWHLPLTGLAWLLSAYPDATPHNPQEAIRLGERACELTGHQDGESLDTLAVALAAAGRFDRAVSTAESALALPSTDQAGKLAKRLRRRLAFYRQAKPYREQVRGRSTFRSGS